MAKKGGNESIEVRLTALEAAVGRLTLQIISSPIALFYPEPIATPLAIESGAVLHHERFFSLLDAAEAFVKYSGAIAIGLYRLAGNSFDVQNEFRKPLSLGTWAEILWKLLQSGSITDNSIAGALMNSFIKPNGKPTPIGRFFLEEFVNIRNEERGHSSSLPDEAYERLHLRHSSVVHDALENCSHMNIPLIRIESVDVATEPISYDIRHLVGPLPLTRTERIQSGSKLRLNSLYIWDKADIFVDLADLLIYKSCPVCNLTHTFFLEKIDNKFLYYHSYFGNHRYKMGK